ncbi:MAG: Spy/CpxP family protein refolding chaperone [Desulfobacterales bacterium]|nr:Spy/CpxP family protein refolding chaperone [Desulfobacterales bacterium]
MKPNKILTLGLALAMILGIALAAEARGPFPGAHGRSAGQGLMNLKSLLELDLSDAQKAEIQKIINQREGEMAALKQQSFPARKDLRKALRSEPLDENDLRKAYQALSSFREEHLVQGAKLRAELKQILTPEQRELLKKQKGHRMERPGY